MLIISILYLWNIFYCSYNFSFNINNQILVRYNPYHEFLIKLVLNKFYIFLHLYFGINNFFTYFVNISKIFDIFKYFF